MILPGAVNQAAEAQPRHPDKVPEEFVAAVSERRHGCAILRTQKEDLPAPKDEFILMLRLYWPKEAQPSIIDGSWKVPEVKEAS